MARQYFSFMDSDEEQVAKLIQIQESYSSVTDAEKKDFYHFLVSLLKDTTQFSKKTQRQAVFCFQHLQQQGLLNEKQQVSVFQHLYKLCDTTLFKKQFNYSNAVSITLREFFNQEAFPVNEIQDCYDYLMTNMSPIPKHASTCQRCWNKTFKQLIVRLGIEQTKEVQKAIYDITGLNIFRNQLNDSYEKVWNDLMNAFYKRFFENVESIRVHDIKSDDKETKIEDKKKQKQGVDKTILLKDGTEILVEEKFREAKYWPNRLTDILLEYISIDTKDIPGWVYTSKSDYLVILYKHPLEMNESEIYVLPFKSIRKWVNTHNEEFMACKDIVATNTNWRTISKEVPLEMIMRMIEKEDKMFKIRYPIQDKISNSR